MNPNSLTKLEKCQLWSSLQVPSAFFSDQKFSDRSLFRNQDGKIPLSFVWAICESSIYAYANNLALCDEARKEIEKLSLYCNSFVMRPAFFHFFICYFFWGIQITQLSLTLPTLLTSSTLSLNLAIRLTSSTLSLNLPNLPISFLPSSTLD